MFYCYLDTLKTPHFCIQMLVVLLKIMRYKKIKKITILCAGRVASAGIVQHGKVKDNI